MRLKASTLPIRELELIAWHHMINDPHLEVYTIDGGIINRKFFNHKLAFQRNMGKIADEFQKFAQQIFLTVVPPFEHFVEAIKRFQEGIKQLGLDYFLSDPDAVELEGREDSVQNGKS